MKWLSMFFLSGYQICAKTKFKEDAVPAALNAVTDINIFEDPFANFNFNDRIFRTISHSGV